MPCQDGGPSLEDIRKADLAMAKKRKEEKEYKERLDLVTRLLCSVMTQLDDKWHINWADYDPDLKDWWNRHRKQDQERRKKEQIEKLNKKAQLQKEIKKMQEELKKL